MSKQNKLRDAGDHFMDEVRALLHYVQSVLVEGEFGQGHSGEMCKQQGACFDRVAKAERLLLVVDSQVW